MAKYVMSPYGDGILVFEDDNDTPDDLICWETIRAYFEMLDAQGKEVDFVAAKHCIDRRVCEMCSDAENCIMLQDS